MGWGNATNHVAHTWEQDPPPFWEWDVREMLEIAAPLAPVT